MCRRLLEQEVDQGLDEHLLVLVATVIMISIVVTVDLVVVVEVSDLKLELRHGVLGTGDRGQRAGTAYGGGGTLILR